ncbi:MAG: YraN family protein [Candidatus Doudnabacteria bacterium]|jgi:Holliday junction resolvase-like predicted endonuclease
MFNFFKSKPIPTQKPKTLGQRGEEFAQQEYIRRGYKVVASNFFNKKGLRKGEVDFIAVNKERIAFVEVKTRHALNKKFGTGTEAVNVFKQTKLLKAVKIFLQQELKYSHLAPGIDVCEVMYNELDSQPFCAKILVNVVEDWN